MKFIKLVRANQLKNDFIVLKQSVISKIREGRKKGFVDSSNYSVNLKDNQLEVIYSEGREFRHPDEYFDTTYDTPKELQEYYRWSSELYNIIDAFVTKYNLELNIHG